LDKENEQLQKGDNYRASKFEISWWLTSLSGRQMICRSILQRRYWGRESRKDLGKERKRRRTWKKSSSV